MGAAYLVNAYRLRRFPVLHGQIVAQWVRVTLIDQDLETFADEPLDDVFSIRIAGPFQSALYGVDCGVPDGVVIGASGVGIAQLVADNANLMVCHSEGHHRVGPFRRTGSQSVAIEPDVQDPAHAVTPS